MEKVTRSAREAVPRGQERENGCPNVDVGKQVDRRGGEKREEMESEK